MMGLASRSRWDDARIAGIIGTPIAEVIEQRTAAYRLGVLDAQTHELTPFGRGLLDRVRKAARRSREERTRLQRSLDDIYYPVSCDGLDRR